MTAAAETTTTTAAITLSVCDGCDGVDQKPYEPLKFTGRYRDWLCAACREAMLEPELRPAAPAGAQR